MISDRIWKSVHRLLMLSQEQLVSSCCGDFAGGAGMWMRAGAELDAAGSSLRGSRRWKSLPHTTQTGGTDRK